MESSFFEGVLPCFREAEYAADCRQREINIPYLRCGELLSRPPKRRLASFNKDL